MSYGKKDCFHDFSGGGGLLEQSMRSNWDRKVSQPRDFAKIVRKHQNHAIVYIPAVCGAAVLERSINQQFFDHVQLGNEIDCTCFPIAPIQNSTPIRYKIENPKLRHNTVIEWRIVNGQVDFLLNIDMQTRIKNFSEREPITYIVENFGRANVYFEADDFKELHQVKAWCRFGFEDYPTENGTVTEPIWTVWQVPLGDPNYKAANKQLKHFEQNIETLTKDHYDTVASLKSENRIIQNLLGSDNLTENQKFQLKQLHAFNYEVIKAPVKKPMPVINTSF